MTVTVTGDAREQVLDVVRRGQELTLDVLKQIIETVNAAAEKLPAVSGLRQTAEAELAAAEPAPAAG